MNPALPAVADAPISAAEPVLIISPGVSKLAPGQEPPPCPFPCSICVDKGRQ